MDNYQIFISYRRDGGDALAGRLADRFNLLGYKVFFDVESMRSGTFNTQVLDAIAQCDDVLLVLPPNALDRCVDDDDWVRQELVFALKHNKNIIPIMMRGFEFPATLPPDIDKIRYMEGVTASSEYFDAVIQRVETLLSSKSVAEQKQTEYINHIKVNNIKVPMFLKTPMSVLPAVIMDCNLNKKLIDGMKHFETLKKSSSLQEFREYCNDLTMDYSDHDLKLEFTCFTNPDENISVALGKYFKEYYDTDALPDGFIEQHKLILSVLAEHVEKVKENKPPYYEAILLEYMGLFFEMEYYYRDDAYDTLCCANTIFSCVFQCYPSESIRKDFYNMRNDPKRDIMKRVSFALQNIKKDDNGILQLSGFLLVMRTCMILFSPQKNKIKRIKRFLLINYKYLKKNHVLNDAMKEAFSNFLNDIDKIKNTDY